MFTTKHHKSSAPQGPDMTSSVLQSLRDSLSTTNMTTVWVPEEGATATSLETPPRLQRGEKRTTTPLTVVTSKNLCLNDQIVDHENGFKQSVDAQHSNSKSPSSNLKGPTPDANLQSLIRLFTPVPLTREKVPPTTVLTDSVASLTIPIYNTPRKNTDADEVESDGWQYKTISCTELPAGRIAEDEIASSTGDIEQQLDQPYHDFKKYNGGAGIAKLAAGFQSPSSDTFWSKSLAYNNLDAQETLKRLLDCLNSMPAASSEAAAALASHLNSSTVRTSDLNTVHAQTSEAEGNIPTKGNIFLSPHSITSSHEPMTPQLALAPCGRGASTAPAAMMSGNADSLLRNLLNTLNYDDAAAEAEGDKYFFGQCIEEENVVQNQREESGEWRSQRAKDDELESIDSSTVMESKKDRRDTMNSWSEQANIPYECRRYHHNRINNGEQPSPLSQQRTYQHQQQSTRNEHIYERYNKNYNSAPPPLLQYSSIYNQRDWHSEAYYGNVQDQGVPVPPNIPSQIYMGHPNNMGIFPLLEPGLRKPDLRNLYTDDRDRMVYVSWIPKKARAYNTGDKRRMELDFKRRLRENLGLGGLTKVLLFPPKGVHCKLIFDCRGSASTFMQYYGGDNRSLETEKWKVDLCRIYEIEMSDRFDKTVVKIEWSQK